MNFLEELQNIWSSQNRAIDWHDLEPEEQKDFATSIAELMVSTAFMDAYALAENSMELYFSDARGIYIPRDFAESLDEQAYLEQTDLVKQAIDYVRLGPDQEHYWDEWTIIEQGFSLIQNNVELTLHQSGDLWLVNTTMLLLAPEDVLQQMWDNIS